MDSKDSKSHNPQKVALFGKIFTSNVQDKWAEALIYEKDLIVYVGNRAGSQQFITDSTTIIELDKDNLVLPGFIDTHMHYLQGGLQLTSHSIEACCSVKELQQQIINHLEKFPHAEWVFADGYRDIMFPQGKPHYKLLDEICPDKPLALTRYDYHAFLVNSKALEIAGITKDTQSPPNGVVEKDEEGIPTGVFHEQAMDLIRVCFPERKKEDFETAFDVSAEILLKEGITGVTDALVKSYRCKTYYETYIKKSEKLPRASLCVLWDKTVQEEVDKRGDTKINLYEITNTSEHERLKIHTVKFFVDGVLDSQTALLEDPYEGTNNHGMQNFEDDYLKKYVSKLHASGIQTHFHTIGDKSIRITLDAIHYAKEQTKSDLNMEDPRHYLAHLQVVNERDYKRCKELNVGANFSPFWAKDYRDNTLTDTFIGPERAKKQYPIKDFMDNGVVVTFGSDWPVTSHRPLDGIETAVTRKLLGKKDGEPWCKSQCLTVEEAIIAYTINSAYVSHRETFTGSLEVGKKADIIVLNKDIFECDPSIIHKTQVSLTILDGKVVHSLFDSL